MSQHTYIYDFNENCDKKTYLELLIIDCFFYIYIKWEIIVCALKNTFRETFLYKSLNPFLDSLVCMYSFWDSSDLIGRSKKEKTERKKKRESEKKTKQNKAQPSNLNKNSKEKISASLWKDLPWTAHISTNWNASKIQFAFFASALICILTHLAERTAHCFGEAFCWFVSRANLPFVMWFHLAFPSHFRI